MKIRIKDLKKEIEKNFESYEEYIAEYYKYQDDIYDIIHDIADDNVDIYNYDLLEWAKDNYSYIEEAMDEFGTATDDRGHADFIRCIMQGQYKYIEETLYNNYDNMLEYLAYYILQDEGIEELEEEKATEISMINFRNINSITELKNKINEILENKEV